MHSIQVPADDDLQQYLHDFFTSPDIWDASVSDHCITPAYLDEINQEADDSLLQDTIYDELGDFQQQVVQYLDVLIQGQQRLGSMLFIHTFMKATLVNKTENH